jgi:predicted  nucleic acid-binding Zn-ribbon protein
MANPPNKEIQDLKEKLAEVEKLLKSLDRGMSQQFDGLAQRLNDIVGRVRKIEKKLAE